MVAAVGGGSDSGEFRVRRCFFAAVNVQILSVGDALGCGILASRRRCCCGVIVGRCWLLRWSVVEPGMEQESGGVVTTVVGSVVLAIVCDNFGKAVRRPCLGCGTDRQGLDRTLVDQEGLVLLLMWGSSGKVALLVIKVSVSGLQKQGQVFATTLARGGS